MNIFVGLWEKRNERDGERWCGSLEAINVAQKNFYSMTWRAGCVPHVESVRGGERGETLAKSEQPLMNSHFCV